MGRISVIDRLYAQRRTALDFSYDNLYARPLLSLLSPYDIEELRKIATSIKLSAKPKVKYAMIENILAPRGFKKIASGTNRVCYKYLDDQSICIKVAIDKVGMNDNPNEFRNQFLLKPFVTKVFEISPCGTVGLFERVVPITTVEEYISIAEDVFKLIITQIVGRYVLDDIGTDYFQNIGVRPGFGPVLLDFPYVYELDGNKLFCNKRDPVTRRPCGGEIDYDAGFNKLICTKCGKRYYAHQLAKLTQNNRIQLRREGGNIVKISVRRGNKVTRMIDPGRSSDVLPAKKVEVTTQKKESSNKDTQKGMKIVVHRRKKAENKPPVEDNKIKQFIPKEEVTNKDNDKDVYSSGENDNISAKDYKTGLDTSLKNPEESPQYEEKDDDKVIVVSDIDMTPSSSINKSEEYDSSPGDDETNGIDEAY